MEEEPTVKRDECIPILGHIIPPPTKYRKIENNPTKHTNWTVFSIDSLIWSSPEMEKRCSVNIIL